MGRQTGWAISRQAFEVGHGQVKTRLRWGISGFLRRFSYTSVVLLCTLIVSTSIAGEIGFVEDFALARDRTAVLKQLIPGSEDFYYYHALHYQNTEQFAKVEALLPPWLERHGETARLREIRHRQALLTYDKDPEKTLAYLREKLGLRFDHERQLPGAKADLPSQLDPNSITRNTLLVREYSQHKQLEGVEDAALDWLITAELTPERRRNLLSRLARPDYPNFVKLIAADLARDDSGGFGSLPIHRQLLLDQLEELVKVRPQLLNETNFVQTYIARLHPTADEDWRHDRELLAKYLDRLWAFVVRLSPVHNSLKAHVLHQQLVLDRARGQYDKGKFLTYIRLPRSAPYVSAKYLESKLARDFPTDLNADFAQVTLLPTIGDDEPLVRSYLAQFFLNAASTKEFEPWVNDVYLKHLFAETKIVNGLGDPEQWYSLLTPELYQQLKERVDIDFAFTNATHYAAGDVVALDVDVKNVSKLLVKVYEINTRNLYRQRQQEIDTSINLDGLVANEELSFEYAEGPLRRMRRHFELKSLTRPGVYVVDFIGNGKSGRALIRKGRLSFVAQPSPAGHLFTILDETHQPVANAELYLGGQHFTADKEGRIAVPFSTTPGPQKIVLCSGDFCTLTEFQHHEESYSLAAGLYIDREQLLPRKKAKVVIRPMLYLTGAPVGVSLLEDVRLVITSTDLDGVSANKEVKDIKLFEDRDTPYEFLTPPRLAKITFQLKAKVQNASRNERQDVSAEETYTLNEIDRTDKTEDLHFARYDNHYTLHLLGKTGEIKPGRAVNLSLKHRDFKEPVQTTLQTDARGRIELGELPEIVAVTATGPEQTSHTWHLPQNQHTYAQIVDAAADQVIELPYLGTSNKPLRSELSLLELRDESFVADRFAAIKLADGLLRIGPLPVGNYDLLLKRKNQRIRLQVAAGGIGQRYVHSPTRRLELKNAHPLSIASVTTTEKDLVVKLANASEFARVHVVASRYLPMRNAFGVLDNVRGREPLGFHVRHAESLYLSGRNIGDEYRYILDRRAAKKFPGNMLERPGLLLNPWAIRSTETSVQDPMSGADFDSLSEELLEMAPEDAMLGAYGGTVQSGRGGYSQSLDFLANTSVVIVNLAADKQGEIKIPLEALGDRQLLQVVAVDAENTTSRWTALSEKKIEMLDLRLAKGLDPNKHFTQQQQVSLLAAKAELLLPDLGGSQLEVYDSLARVYGLYVTLSQDPNLIEFGFITRWNQLKAEEKRAMYSKYACHELSFFLSRKDPEFFEAVVVPHLKNKKDKTYLDRYLIGDDLAGHREPWRYGRLNIVERILLGRRIAAEMPYAARNVEDLLALQAVDLGKRHHLFQTALLGRALETSGSRGLAEDVKEELLKEEVRFGVRVIDRASIPFDNMPMPPAPVVSPKPEPNSVDRDIVTALASVEAAPTAKEREKAIEQLKDLQKSIDEAEPLDGRERGYYESTNDWAAFSKKRKARQLFRQVDQTQEWAENNYYKLLIEQQNAELVTAGAFWHDFAKAEPGKPFYSPHLAEASRNFAEMMFALAVLDLPFESGEHATEFDGPQLRFTAASPAIVFHEEIKEAGAMPEDAKILVSQNFFQASDRYRVVDNEQVDKYVAGEFLIHTVYGCQVVVTNPTSSRQKLDVLLQIPVGALAVAGGQATRGVPVDLPAFGTKTVDYYFYFPTPGKFPHYPVHVSKNGQLVAHAEPVTLNVVAEPSEVDRESWEFVSQQGTDDDVLAFLKTRNLLRVDLARIAFRLKDAKFFVAAIEILDARHTYNHVLWSYAVQHNTPPRIAQFLQHADSFVGECGLALSSPLLAIDPVARATYQHLEYKPLVNARAHALGKQRQIVNDRLFGQYMQTMALLSYRRDLSDDDLLAVTYYLLLRDRTTQALDTFARVNANALATKLQYDYCSAWLDMVREQPERAAATAAKYAEYPVDRWRNAFAAISAQVKEIGGEEQRVIDPESRDQQTGQLASTDPSLEFVVEGKQVLLTHANLAAVTVNYYTMDIEFLFSRNPFVQEFGSEFSVIRPNLTQQLKLDPQQKGTTFTIPHALQTSNVLVEISGGGQTRTQPAFANALTVRTSENYGQVTVLQQATGKPLAKTYVKVYSQRADGSVKFYKDGYTDHRGKFDYASVSTNELDNVQRFSLLVMSEGQGALIREAAPPQR